MSPTRSTVFFGTFAFAMTFFGLWKKLWICGLLLACWIPFSLKYFMRGVARRHGISNAV